jgi:hypothetical protein
MQNEEVEIQVIDKEDASYEVSSLFASTFDQVGHPTMRN